MAMSPRGRCGAVNNGPSVSVAAGAESVIAEGSRSLLPIKVE